jgi:YVTN family beta-propeller protein
MKKEIIRRGLAAASLLGVLILSRPLTQGGAPPFVPGETEPRMRRPVALATAEHGKWLFAANRSTGSITVIDTAALKTVAEVIVGRRLSDVAVTPDGRHVAVVDEEANELVLLERHESALEIASRLKVSPTPVSVRIAADGSRCFVVSLWSRRLSVIELAEVAKPRIAKTVAMPFAPRRLLPVRDDSRLIVADSFGGRLAVVDVGRGAVESVRTLPAHNIRGLALDRGGSHVLLTHQVLNSLAETTFEDVHWGNLLTNNLRSVSLAGLLQPGADVLADSCLHLLGDVAQGAGDPAGLAVGSDGTVVIALAGTNEITFGQHPDKGWQRLGVGWRPTALALSPDSRRAFVANTFSDSVSVVDLVARKVVAEIELGRQPEPSLSERGEMLFFDARLSHDSWFSCHSCHTDGHTNGLLNDNLGDSSFGAAKRVLSLLGARDTGPWAWNGSMPSLEGQIRKSIETTMRGRPPTQDQVRALAAYLRTLGPAPPVSSVQGESDAAAVRRGKEVFARQACGRCHTPPAFTSEQTYDVGLTDDVGNRLFNPPSLRGISQGGPFFHDNRAGTLEEVFTRHRHQLKGELAKQDLEDLVAYLRSL